MQHKNDKTQDGGNHSLTAIGFKSLHSLLKQRKSEDSRSLMALPYETLGV